MEMPWISNPPEPLGRRLPNGSIIVAPDAAPSLLYKFSPWVGSVLARNEIDIYSVLQGTGDLPGIVRMEGISGTEDHLVRVMERSHIGSLENFLRGNARGCAAATDLGLARSILRQIAETMGRVHDAGVVHRDLKAENILMFELEQEEPGAPQICAKVSDFDRAAILPNGAVMTEPVGSLFHMAPELLASAEYDRQVDIYAFGVLMFEVMHGGARPYGNVAAGMPGSLPHAEFADKVVNGAYRPVWQHEDEDLKRLAERCWATDPSLRPEFKEVLELLEPVSLRHRSTSAKAKQYRASQRIDTLGMASTIGTVRRTMEDSASILSTADALICGIFDGLRGSRTSELTAWRLPLALADQFARIPSDTDTAISNGFDLTEATVRRMEARQESGSTATILLIQPQELLVAWLGDSPAWLFRKPSESKKALAVPLISAHHPDREDEAIRLASSGAHVRREERMLDSGEVVPWGPMRVFVGESGRDHGIALSRALGLSSFSPAVSHKPEMVHLQRQADDLFLVLGSDGVFEVLTPQKVYDIVSSTATIQDAADAVIDAVLKAGAPDNASVIVVDLRVSIPSWR